MSIEDDIKASDVIVEKSRLLSDVTRLRAKFSRLSLVITTSTIREHGKL